MSITKELGERIMNLRKEHNITREELANEFEMPYTTLRNYEKGVREPGHLFLIKIAKKFGVTIDYLLGVSQESKSSYRELLTINGGMSFSAKEIDHIQKYRALNEHGKKMVDFVLEEEYESSIEADQEPYFYMFPRFSGNRASAGYGYDLSNPDEWREICVVDTPEAHRADFAVQIEGDSMMPDYHDGDIVYIVMASEIPIGQVGLFMQNGLGYIKEAGKDRPISRNPEYPDVNPEEGDIKCVGRVIGIAQLVEE